MPAPTMQYTHTHTHTGFFRHDGGIVVAGIVVEGMDGGRSTTIAIDNSYGHNEGRKVGRYSNRQTDDSTTVAK